jgi:hypothetical protein
VTTPERTLQGTYFRSDEQMRHYTVSNSKGSFMAEDMTGENKNQETAPGDTTQQQTEPILRPQAQKHAKTPQEISE